MKNENKESCRCILGSIIVCMVVVALMIGMLIMAIIKGEVDTVTLEPYSGVTEQIHSEQLIQGFGGY